MNGFVLVRIEGTFTKGYQHCCSLEEIRIMFILVPRFDSELDISVSCHCDICHSTVYTRV
jgi:hypothetical protein